MYKAQNSETKLKYLICVESKDAPKHNSIKEQICVMKCTFSVRTSSVNHNTSVGWRGESSVKSTKFCTKSVVGFPPSTPGV